MAIADILRNFKPFEGMFKVKIDTIVVDNSKFKVTTTGEKTYLTDYTPSDKKEEEKLISGGEDFCSEAILPEIIKERAIISSTKEVLKRAKLFLTPDDFKLLSFCYYILKLEDSDMNEESRDKKHELKRRFGGERGLRFYNIVRAGLFDINIYGEMKNSNPGTDKDNITSRLEVLLTAPNYIFVNKEITEEELILDILIVHRKMTSGSIALEPIFVYSRGARLMELVSKACKNMTITTKFNIANKSMQFGSQNANKTILTPKELVKKW